MAIEDHRSSSANAYELEPQLWPGWPDIWALDYVCFANYGRSKLAEIETRIAISEGLIPKFFVNSGSLSFDYKDVLPGLHPLTVAEIERAENRILKPWEIARDASKPLQDCYPGADTDILVFLPGPIVEEYLPYHLGRLNKPPRSVICYPLDDPSAPSTDMSPADAMAITHERIKRIVRLELKDIMINVRNDTYKGMPHHYRNGIHYPQGFDPEEFKQKPKISEWAWL